MNFRRPFRAEIVGDRAIWIVDAHGAFVASFPRLSDDIEQDLARAAAVASADRGEELVGDADVAEKQLQPA